MRRRRFWIILAAALVAEVLLVAAWKGWFAPAPEVSALYMRYVDDPGVEASFAKDFRINDTLAIDATLLRAKDSAAWERLLEDFNLSKAIDPEAYNSPHSFTIGRVLIDDYTKNVSSPDEPFYIRVAFPYEKEIHLYYVEDIKQSTDLRLHLLITLSNKQ